MPTTHFNTEIPPEMAGYRLDKALAMLLPAYSRARLQQWIQAGWVRINAVPGRAKDKVNGGEKVEITANIVEDAVTWQPQAIPLDIVYEDAAVLVVNKPAGLVVHPGAGNPDHTLVNALLHYAPELSQLPRAGIIHRLDKDTSGLLVVSKNLTAHTHLVNQLQARHFLREYQAIVKGVLIAGGTVEAPIGRHPTQRMQMAVIDQGKPAVTHYRVIERYQAHTHIQLRLETGRTHQIRVHMAYQRYPIVGDPVYGGRLKLPPASEPKLQEALRNFSRQALHATQLGFLHPTRQEFMRWSVPLPADMQALLHILKG